MSFCFKEAPHKLCEWHLGDDVDFSVHSGQRVDVLDFIFEVDNGHRHFDDLVK